MSEEKNEKKSIWVYAVILFTSAFIVLLLTAYSQIKFNRNLSDYKNQLYTEENAKNDFKMNLGTALGENKKLGEELKSIEQELADTKVKLEESSAALKRQQQKNISSLSAYDLLLQAQIENSKGNILESADILYNKIDSKLLEKAGMELFEELVAKVYVEAAEILYNQGYSQYLNRDYDGAVESLKKSLDYSAYEYFSDDCLYFIAYSRYRQENYKEAKEYMNKIINDYPGSNYKNQAEALIKQMGF